MNVNKMTPVWYVQGSILRLSLQYMKKNETSDGYSGCSSNWMKNLEDSDFVTAYNSIVDAAKQEFHLPNMKKIKVPKETPPVKIIVRNQHQENNIVIVAMVSISLLVGAVIGSIFF